jgi:hypothetical protein
MIPESLKKTIEALPIQDKVIIHDWLFANNNDVIVNELIPVVKDSIVNQEKISTL